MVKGEKSQIVKKKSFSLEPFDQFQSKYLKILKDFLIAWHLFSSVSLYLFKLFDFFSRPAGKIPLKLLGTKVLGRREFKFVIFFKGRLLQKISKLELLTIKNVIIQTQLVNFTAMPQSVRAFTSHVSFTDLI